MKQKLLIILAVGLGFVFQSLKEYSVSPNPDQLTCYDTFQIGHTYLSINCNACTGQFCNDYLDQSRCTK